jgi:DNA-binding CsgD family transcriptional regulator
VLLKLFDSSKQAYPAFVHTKSGICPMHFGVAGVLHTSYMRLMAESIDGEPSLLALLAAVLVLAIAGGAVDLYFDAPDSWWSVHAVYEVGLIAVEVAASIMLWRGWWRSRHELVETRHALETHDAERAMWRASAEAALNGFARAVDERFSAWALTPTEREIGLRLLKGHSHKQIAFETGRSERTVRQHAVVIYQKSGLGGRAELSAFFLDDLLLPSGRLESGRSHHDNAMSGSSVGD